MTTIPITEITEGDLDGSGYFDKLMLSVNQHIDYQFKLGRIKGSDYATVYLGALQAAMQQAIGFALGRQQADKQAELLAAQILELSADTERKDLQSDKDLELKNIQIAKIAADKDLVDQKKLTEIEQTILVTKQQTVYEKQAIGFDRDVEQKALKPYIDLWTIGRGTETTGINTPNTLEAHLNTLMQQLVLNSGFNITTVGPF